MDIDAFFKGYKPSLLYNPNYEYEIYLPEQMKKLKKYPCLKKVIVFKQEQEIYFQTEEAKDSFLQKMKNVDPDSNAFHRELGLVMGFPPRAVAFYIKRMQEETLEWKKIRMEYCGISCVGNIDDIMENVSWFWRLDIPSHEYRIIKLEYSFLEPSFTYHIQYKDIDGAGKAREEIQLLAQKRKKSTGFPVSK